MKKKKKKNQGRAWTFWPSTLSRVEIAMHDELSLSGLFLVWRAHAYQL
jgi:hypothetical protein